MSNFQALIMEPNRVFIPTYIRLNKDDDQEQVCENLFMPHVFMASAFNSNI